MLLLTGRLFARTAQAPLESEPASARVTALGGAGLALEDGSDWIEGPSALAVQPSWSLHAHQQSLAAGIQRQWLEGLDPLNSWLGLGLGLGYTSFGSLEARDEGGALTGTFEPKRMSGALGLGAQLGHRFNAGLALHAYQEDLASVSFSAFVPSLSVDYSWSRNGKIVIAGDTEGLSTALSTRLRSFQRLSFDFQGGYSLSTGVTTGLGAELSLDAIAFRLGWSAPGGVTDSPLTGFRAGLGAHWQAWSLDYVWLPQGTLGDSHRFSLSFSPQAPVTTPVPTPAATPLPVPPLESSPPPLPELNAPVPASATAAPALELEFRLPESTSDEAILADEKGGEAKALALYQDAIKQNPADTRAWMGLGHLYYRRHEMDAALQCFEQVLRLNPTETALREWVDKVKAKRVKTP